MLSTISRVTALLFVVSLGLSSPARADQPCSGLTPDKGSLGFQRRTQGERCEGFFKSNVAGEAVSVAFLMTGRFPAAADVVEVSGAGPDRPINVRAVALPLGTYYRMDAVIGPGKPLRWPLSEVVQASRNLKSNDLGVYGWFGDVSRPTFVPVRASAPGAAAPAEKLPLRLGVRANVPLALIVYSVTNDESCHFGATAWTRLASNVRPGAVLQIERAAEGAAMCIGFRAKVADSDRSEPLTVRIHLR